MKNDGRFMTRKEQQRAEFEERFYATWPNEIACYTDQQLISLNEDKLKDVNAGYSDTMLCLKSWVLQEMARRGI
jgi:hypothetical protein